jgi:hypothetical protein
LASNEGAEDNATPAAPTATTLGAPAAGIARSTIIEGMPKLTVTLPGATKPDRSSSASLTEPHRLGGPSPHIVKGNGKKASQQSLTAMHTDDAADQDPPVREFLHQAHAAACRIFGTTLGPEANADHRNHFHVDMAPRKFTKICD